MKFGHSEDWPRCREWINASAQFSPVAEPIERIEERLENGEYQFWPGENCAAVTEVAEFCGRKALIIRFGGGSLEELLSRAEPALCAVAKALGCSFVMSEGRKGWERAAFSAGYRFAWITMVKELS